MGERKVLRFLLQRFVKLCQHRPLQKSRIAEMISLMDLVTPKVLEVHLPTPIESSYCSAPAMFCEIYESPSVHCSIFGLRAEGDVLPLHDHPHMYGFIKVLQGAIEVTSFSCSDTPRGVGTSTSASYNGIHILTPESTPICLRPNSGNIHRVRAMEPGSFFFDVLVPGYKENPCSYFQMPSALPNVGEEVKLNQIAQPHTFYCAQLYYDRINEL